MTVKTTATAKAKPHPLLEKHEAYGANFTLRAARVGDAKAAQKLFEIVYQGRYTLDFGKDPEVLRAQIARPASYLWLVAETVKPRKLVGAMMFALDERNRLGKAAGAVVLPDFRKYGIASSMLKLGIRYLTEERKLIDVIYGTTRTISEGPFRMTAEAGFVPTGIFPNAVQVEASEHLSLDVFLTENAFARRRKTPYVFGPFLEFYEVARKQIGLEPAAHVTEREPLALSPRRLTLELSRDEGDSVERFRRFSEEGRLSNPFFPFHLPHWRLFTADGGTDVFVWYEHHGKQASILGYRTDLVHTQDLLDAVAWKLREAGAAYVELLVDAYDYMLQQEAYTARYIPSAYFPAMKLASDGARDDYFVLSRTFQLLDFSNTFVSPENFEFLQAYMRYYTELYIDPVRRKMAAQAGAAVKKPARRGGARR
jgi:hypothetical protein